MGMRDRPYNAVTRVVRRASQLSGARNTFTSFANSFCALWSPSLFPSPPSWFHWQRFSNYVRIYLTFFRPPLPNTLVVYGKENTISRPAEVKGLNFCFIRGGLAWSNLGRIDWFNLIETFERLLDRIDSEIYMIMYRW